MLSSGLLLACGAGSDLRRALSAVAAEVAAASPERETTTPPDTGQGAPDPAAEQALADYPWTELPARTSGADYLYVTHFATLGDRTVRNYSMCYDPAACTALWVAYPLHKCYLGNSGRTNRWICNPKIPAGSQVDVSRSYGGPYQRGHQIPSADRTATPYLNQQTFYWTNSTPQTGDRLNATIWADLEKLLRNKWICPDTLFVVTGCVLTTREAPDTTFIVKNGRRVAVPKAYYKAVLRTKGGRTGAAPANANAMCIGVWLDNRSYSEERISSKYAVSVAEIERRTGLTLFPGISAAVKRRCETARWDWDS